MAIQRGPDGKFVSTRSTSSYVDKDDEYGTPLGMPASDSNEIRILKKTIKNLKRQISGLKTGKSLITEAVKQAYEEPPDLWIPPLPARKTSKKSDEIAVLHLSDSHIGKLTPSYDCSVAEERLLQMTDKVIKITKTRRNSANINELRLYLGGDMIEGENIFAHQAHLITESLFEQAVKTSPSILCKVILNLAQVFRKIHVCAIPGNHGRNGPRNTPSHPKTNWDSICYEVLRIMLVGNDPVTKGKLSGRVTFNISDDFYVVDHIYDWGNLIVHGHEIRGGFAGLPWYGVAKRAWGWIDSIPEPWDYLWFGHFHTYASATLNHRVFLANGAVESDNDYARQNMSAAGFPCQRLCFFSRKHGLISDNQIFMTAGLNRLPSQLKLKGYLNIPKET